MQQNKPQKSINAVAVKSAHNAKYKENRSSCITQQPPLQFIKSHHRKTWKTVCLPLKSKQPLWDVMGGKEKNHIQKTKKQAKKGKRKDHNKQYSHLLH